MKILIAPDSFKECLSSREVAMAIAEGIKVICPHCDITSIPVADGGEGTVEALMEATQGSILDVDSVDALMRPVHSFIGITGDKHTAVIEMAAASGIGLIHPSERNPLITSTYGTGLLIRHALEKGYKKIIIGIGGSATNDGGMGMAAALGYKFRDKNGKEVTPGGRSLKNISSIDDSGVIPELKSAVISVACDVTNTLCGPHGASVVFGPQKGATPEMVQELDAGLYHFARVIKEKLYKDVIDVPGAGAAGGLGAGLLAFTPAVLKSGFDIVKEVTGLEQRIQEADLVFTAEGKVDYQTQFGKTPFGVAQIALKYKKPVLALAGTIGNGAEVLLDKGITAYFSITDKPMTLEESVRQAPVLLKNTVSQIMKLVLMNKH
jgi:glycerate kinase